MILSRVNRVCFPLDITGENRYNNHVVQENGRAGVMELADVTDSKSVELITRVGSSPTAGIISKHNINRQKWRFFFAL